MKKEQRAALLDRIQADRYLSEALARRPPNLEEIAWAKQNVDNNQQVWDAIQVKINEREEV